MLFRSKKTKRVRVNLKQVRAYVLQNLIPGRARLLAQKMIGYEKANDISVIKLISINLP